MIITLREIQSRIRMGALGVEPEPNWSEAGPCDIPVRLSADFVVLREHANTQRLCDKLALTRPGAPGMTSFPAAQAARYVIPPNGRVAVRSLERLVMPCDLAALVALRSTYARLGLVTSPTLVDPGFEGHLVLEICGGAFPIEVGAGDALFKLVFFNLRARAEPYSGHFQFQDAVLIPECTSSARSPEPSGDS